MKAFDLAINELTEIYGSCPMDSHDWERPEGCRENCGEVGFEPNQCYKKYYEEKAKLDVSGGDDEKS